jgi:hypothetical protein
VSGWARQAIERREGEKKNLTSTDYLLSANDPALKWVAFKRGEKRHFSGRRRKKNSALTIFSFVTNFHGRSKLDRPEEKIKLKTDIVSFVPNFCERNKLDCPEEKRKITVTFHFLSRTSANKVS